MGYGGAARLERNCAVQRVLEVWCGDDALHQHVRTALYLHVALVLYSMDESACVQHCVMKPHRGNSNRDH